MSSYADVDFDSVLIETDGAILFNIDEEEIWIPLSVIDTDSFDEQDKVVSVEIWYATKEGLI